MTKKERQALILEYSELKTLWVDCIKSNKFARANAYMRAMQQLSNTLDAETSAIGEQLEFSFMYTIDE